VRFIHFPEDNAMVKKINTTSRKKAAPSAAAGLLDSQLAASVRDSAQQIWLAGMGAFAKAQAEGGKVFETLVKEGMSLQKKTQGMAEEKISEVTGKMTAMAGTVQAKAGQNWDKLEAIFEARTAKAMNKLGVPTAKDLAALTERVDALAAAVSRLSKGAPAAAPKAPRAARAVKAVKAVAKSVVKAPVKAPAKAPAKRASRKSAPAA
jgi:poly(hydroxyalkanoate) granule-associated protein